MLSLRLRGVIGLDEVNINYFLLLFLLCILIVPILIGFNLYFSCFYSSLLILLTAIALVVSLIPRYMPTICSIIWITQIIEAAWSRVSGQVYENRWWEHAKNTQTEIKWLTNILFSIVFTYGVLLQLITQALKIHTNSP